MITSRANPRVKWVRALQNQRRLRQQEGLFVIEGLRWVREALEARAEVKLVLHTDHLDERGRGLLNTLARRGCEILTVSDPVMAACSDTRAPQGLLAVLPIPQLPLPAPLDLALIVDRMADPGNLGTVLRTAAAAGVQAVFATEGSVEVTNPKVVRAAMGAHLRLPIYTLGYPELAERLQGMPIWLAEARAGRPYTQIDWHPAAALALGGEAHGPSPELRRLASGQTHIPMPGSAESLNAAVAAAILLFEILRQRELA
jgi:TrmH family RNA methyltransferase